MFSFNIFMYIFFTLSVVSITALIANFIGKEILMAVYAALVVIGAILAHKVVMFGAFTVPAGIIVASSTFFVTDILSEIWGKSEAKKAVTAGLLSLIILVISQYIAVAWDSPDFAKEHAENFNAVLSTSPRIVLASILGFLVSQFLDVTIYNHLKWVNKGKKLWLRNNVSTITSMTADTLIFIPIAFVGRYPFPHVLQLMLGITCVKIIISFLDTPFFYFIIWFIKKMDKRFQKV